VPEGRRIFAELTVGRTPPRSSGTAQPWRRRRVFAAVYELFPIVEDFGARQAAPSRRPATAARDRACPRRRARRPTARRAVARLAPTVVDVVCRVHSPRFAIVALRAARGTARRSGTVAAADRCHVLANGELRLTLGPGDATTPMRSWRRISHDRQLADLCVRVQFGAIYALMAVRDRARLSACCASSTSRTALVMAAPSRLLLAYEWGWPVWAGSCSVSQS